MIQFAKIISTIFHPALLIFFLPFLIVYRQTESSLYALKWQMFSSLFVFLSGFTLFMGERIGIFSDSDLTKRKERGKFYGIISIIIVSYIAIVIILKGILFMPVIIAFGSLFGVLLFTLLNHLFKVSIHSGVACAFVISLGILYGINAFFAVVWIVPLMIWARLKLKKHTIIEAISGGTLGAVITLTTYWVGRNFL